MLANTLPYFPYELYQQPKFYTYLVIPIQIVVLHIERAWLKKSLDKLNTLDLCFPYSADCELTVNKNWFDFV